MKAEWDSENLCMELRRRHGAGQQFSSLFWEFEKRWRPDELEHFHGFTRLLWLLYGTKPEASARFVKRRPADFASLQWALSDELAMLVFIAVDEIAAQVAYTKDVPVYQKMGHPAFQQWVKTVALDEHIHYRNALHVIKRGHYHRLTKVPNLLNQVLEWYGGGQVYGGGFLGDPDVIDTSPKSLEHYRASILRDLDR
jgi:hypothetical protein